jgi:predicted MPP superfamily phosphohydrolase
MATGAALAPIGAYGTIYERDDIEIVRHAVKVSRLPAQLDGLKVVQLSDLHVAEISRVHHRMLDLVRGIAPDVVVVTGDLVDVDTAVDNAADLIGSIAPARGAFAVPGDRDHLAEAIYPLSQALAARNGHLLVNRSVQLDDRLWIVGVDDPSGRNDDLTGALQNVSDDAVRILLAHSPHITQRLGGARFDLVLAGHTHGGQVNLPLLRNNWLRDDVARRYAAGAYRLDGSTLYVNRGVGTFYLPVRIGARPEITLFSLHAA